MFTTYYDNETIRSNTNERSGLATTTLGHMEEPLCESKVIDCSRGILGL